MMPGLAHRAADHLLVAPRLVDQLPRAGEAGADRRAQALREVDPGRVEAARPVGRRHAGRDDRVHAAARRRGARAGRGARATLEHAAHLLERPHPPARDVRRLLDRDQARARRVAVAARPDRRLDLLRREDARASPSSGAVIAPEKTAGPPASKLSGCDVRSSSTSSPPGRMCSRKAIALHIVPVGRNSAASWPSSSATRSWSASTVGSAKRLLVADLGLGDRAAHRRASAGSACRSRG